MNVERIAKHRAAVLRPILELEKNGGPISSAIGDAAWELGLAKSYTWKLYRRLKENDARAVALQPGRRGPKPGKGRLGGRRCADLAEPNPKNNGPRYDRTGIKTLVSTFCLSRGTKQPGNAEFVARVPSKE